MYILQSVATGLALYKRLLQYISISYLKATNKKKYPTTAVKKKELKKIRLNIEMKVTNNNHTQID